MSDIVLVYRRGGVAKYADDLAWSAEMHGQREWSSGSLDCRKLAERRKKTIILSDQEEVEQAIQSRNEVRGRFLAVWAKDRSELCRFVRTSNKKNLARRERPCRILRGTSSKILVFRCLLNGRMFLSDRYILSPVCRLTLSGVNDSCDFLKRKREIFGPKNLFSPTRDSGNQEQDQSSLGDLPQIQTRIDIKNYMLKRRLRLFDATVSLTLCYAAGTWTPNKEHERMIQSTQRKMLRLIIQTKRKYKKIEKQDIEPKEEKGIVDITEICSTDDESDDGQSTKSKDDVDSEVT